MAKEIRIKMIRIVIESSGYTAIDITSYVDNAVKSQGLYNGFVHVFTSEKKCSVTLIEYEPELLSDLEEFLKRIGCIDIGLCDAIIGKSAIVPVVNNTLFLGQFKRIVFIDTSNVTGEKGLVLTIEGVFKEH
uniref:YjbQ family protein n=1 Tax=Ignisphaera aggregans TaxID=334771 RepID=A0A7C5YUB0_9CREN